MKIVTFSPSTAINYVLLCNQSFLSVEDKQHYCNSSGCHSTIIDWEASAFNFDRRVIHRLSRLVKSKTNLSYHLKNMPQTWYFRNKLLLEIINSFYAYCLQQNNRRSIRHQFQTICPNTTITHAIHSNIKWSLLLPSK